MSCIFIGTEATQLTAINSDITTKKQQKNSHPYDWRILWHVLRKYTRDGKREENVVDLSRAQGSAHPLIRFHSLLPSLLSPLCRLVARRHPSSPPTSASGMELRLCLRLHARLPSAPKRSRLPSPAMVLLPASGRLRIGKDCLGLCERIRVITIGLFTAATLRPSAYRLLNCVQVGAAGMLRGGFRIRPSSPSERTARRCGGFQRTRPPVLTERSY